ncbi:hypothetical protein MRX96_031478, partial [Rhipicephalus microplus]
PQLDDLCHLLLDAWELLVVFQFFLDFGELVQDVLQDHAQDLFLQRLLHHP